MEHSDQHRLQKRSPFDEQLAMLANEERRQLLLTLFEAHRRHETPIEVADAGAGAEEPTRKMAMIHQHLPRLEDRGFVSWDRAEQLVTVGPHFREIEPLLDALVTNRDDLPYELEA